MTKPTHKLRALYDVQCDCGYHTDRRDRRAALQLIEEHLVECGETIRLTVERCEVWKVKS